MHPRQRTSCNIALRDGPSRVPQAAPGTRVAQGLESVKLLWRTASVHQQDGGQLSGWQLLLKHVAALCVALLIDYLPHKRPAVQGHPKLRSEGKAVRPRLCGLED